MYFKVIWCENMMSEYIRLVSYTGVRPIVTCSKIYRVANSTSRKHKLNINIPLPPKKMKLCVTDNKVQLISENRLINSQGVSGHIQQRINLRTTHEEADILLVQHMVKLATSESIRISILSYDRDVYLTWFCVGWCFVIYNCAYSKE